MTVDVPACGMVLPTLTLFLGGTRSGKSLLAEQEARMHGKPVIYVATARGGDATGNADAAMQERIQTHRARRPSNWETLEAPLHLPDVLEKRMGSVFAPTTILIDCMTLWLSNILFSLPESDSTLTFPAAAQTATETLLALIERSQCHWIVVSGEVGLGGIAANAMQRAFTDGLGLANQLLASRATNAYFCVAGKRLRLE